MKQCYLNQIFVRKIKLNEVGEILSKVDVVELLKQRNIKLLLKFLYFKTRMILGTDHMK